MASEPANLWSLGSGKQDNNALIIQNCLTDSLVKYDRETNEISPCLATAWEWVDDKHIQFTLRDDVMMSDNTPLEAANVVYTVRTAAEKSPTNDCGRYFDPETTKVVDERTVIVGVNTVAPDFLAMLAESAFGIVSEGDIEAVGGIEAAVRNPLFGSGEYKFKEWQAGQYILLERNDDYWDKETKCYFKQIKFSFTNDAAAREMAVRAGMPILHWKFR